MASDKSQLLEMGFEAARVEWALKATSSSGLQPAMDHIIAHMDDPVPDPSVQGAKSATRAGEGDDDDDEDDKEALAAHVKKMGGKVGDEEEVAAKSVKCTECGKLFKNASLVSFHAEKSGHSNFEESTEEFVPLTEEQKKERLAELREKLVEKRAAQAKLASVEFKANEAIRRKATQDLGDIKENLALKEAEKEAAQRKKDKIDDAKAKAAIKAQIEADKKARAEKAARDKALRAGLTPPQPAGGHEVGSSGAAKALSGGGSGGARKDCRLQVRLASGGAPLTKTFPADSPLSDVAEWICSESLSYSVDTIQLSTTFPRKVFARGEMGKSLRECGLVPSAVSLAVRGRRGGIDGRNGMGG